MEVRRPSAIDTCLDDHVATPSRSFRSGYISNRCLKRTGRRLRLQGLRLQGHNKGVKKHFPTSEGEKCPDNKKPGTSPGFLQLIGKKPYAASSCSSSSVSLPARRGLLARLVSTR